MEERALPPVLVLISDGQPTDDFDTGLSTLMRQPWAQKAVRLAIAMGHDADLMASRLGLEEMRAHIGADTLGFLSLEGMMRAITDAPAPSGPDGFCNACFTGRYPIEVTLAQPKLGFEGVLA